MKGLVYTGPGAVEVRELAEPAPRSDAAKIRLRYCGVCGTDIGIFSGQHPRATAPLVLGHEFVGTVEEVKGDGGFAPGDRVVAYPLASCGHCRPCRNGTPHVCTSLRLIGIDSDGGMANYVWVDQDALFMVPDDLPDDVAALIEPIAVVVHALHQAGFRPLDRCVVTGAGPIGLLTAIALRHAGASEILISDVDAGRLSIARKLGFDVVDASTEDVVERVLSATNGEGADVVFECSGVATAASEMTRLARVGGTLCITASHKKPREVALLDINFKEQKIVGTRVYTKQDFADAIPFAGKFVGELRQLITQVVPLSQSAGVFQTIADPGVTAVKVLVDCEA